MNTKLQNIGRLNPFLLLIVITLLITACGGISAYLIFVAPDLFGGLLAIVFLTIAVVLPIHQKRFSLLSILLTIGAVAFLLSGSVQNAYDTVVRPLPVHSQIEFSKIMRPSQVSRGLSNIGFGSLYVLISLVVFQSKRVSEKVNHRWLKFLFWSMFVMGILFTITGINSVVDGLSKL